MMSETNNTNDKNKEFNSSASSIIPSNDTTQQKRKRTESGCSDPGLHGFLAVLGASPPKFVGLEELMAAAVGLNNMALAHEIVVNSDFKIQKSPNKAGSIHEKVNEIMHGAFWDALQDSLTEKPPNFRHALILFDEIKEILLSLLLPQHTKLKQEIDDKLDTKLVEQQAEHGMIDFNKYGEFILNIMSKICAPIRDDQIKRLREIKELVPLFRGIFEVLDLMRIDMANFTIQTMRPKIQQYSVEYEREQFEKYLQTTNDALIHTQEWLHRAIRALIREESNQRDFAAIQPPSQKCVALSDDKVPSMGDKITERPSCSHAITDFLSDAPACKSVSDTLNVSHNAVITEAYLELLKWSDNRPYPETLRIDQARLYDARSNCCRLVTATAVIAIAANLGGKSITDFDVIKEKWKESCLLLVDDCDDYNSIGSSLPNVAEQVIKDYQQFCDKLQGEGVSGVPSWSADTECSLRTQIIALNNENNQVRSIMEKRLFSFVKSVIFNPGAFPIKIPSGLAVIQKELARLTGQFLRLTSYNRQVFGEHYDRIIDARIRVLNERRLAKDDTCSSDTILDDEQSE